MRRKQKHRWKKQPSIKEHAQKLNWRKGRRWGPVLQGPGYRCFLLLPAGHLTKDHVAFFTTDVKCLIRELHVP